MDNVSAHPLRLTRFALLPPPCLASLFPSPLFTLHCLPLAKLSMLESSNCICRAPCNMTRYNKELSMVKIPSKTSARYLGKKFNRSEKYIT